MFTIALALAFAVLVAPAAGILNEEPLTALTLDVASDGVDNTLQKWTLGGDAEVSDDVVVLTADKQSQRGWIQSAEPANTLGHEWRIDIQLRIGGEGVSLYGDGAAVWLTKEPFAEGEVFARQSTWTGLGLFLDTYDNAPGKHVHKHPYISAFVSDGGHSFNYAELEADDPALEDPSHAASRAHAGCHARIRQYGRDPKVVTLRLEYDGEKQELKAVMFLGRRRDQYRSAASYAWQHCFTLHGVVLPPGYWLGASASTGQLTDAHEVLSIETRGQMGAHAGQVPAHVANGTPDPAFAPPVDSPPIPGAEVPGPGAGGRVTSPPAAQGGGGSTPAQPPAPRRAAPASTSPCAQGSGAAKVGEDEVACHVGMAPAVTELQRITQGLQSQLQGAMAQLSTLASAQPPAGGGDESASGSKALVAVDSLRRRVAELSTALSSVTGRIGSAAQVEAVTQLRDRMAALERLVDSVEARTRGGPWDWLTGLLPTVGGLAGLAGLGTALMVQRRLGKMHLP